MLHSARAFRPGGQWYGGVPLVPSDCCCHHCGAWLWPLVGRCLVAPQGWHRMLLCDVGSSLVIGSQPGGGGVPLRCSGGQHTFVPLCQHWVVWWHLRCAAVTCVSTTLGPWGLLVTWCGVASVPSFALGVAVCSCGDFGVVVCAGCVDCVTHLCTTLGAWLC